MKKIFISLSFLFFLLPLAASARDVSKISDWYIKNFQTEIIVNTDSSLLITERITADCGTLPDKHGIFRTLPTFYKKDPNVTVKTPVNLKSITDFDGNEIKYSQSTSYFDKTVTWKIGNPNKAVTGENNYLIKYEVKNAIRFDNPNSDEFYWNILGNFWDLEIDNFSAKIYLPEGINQGNANAYAYSGSFGSKENSAASYSWTTSNILEITSSRTLAKDEGITASLTFPKNIITPHTPSWWEKYGAYLYLLIIPIVLFVSFRVWKRYGRDFKLKRSITPEYDIPDNLSPIEFSLLFENYSLQTKAVTAAIINLAVKGYLKIEQLEKKNILSQKDFLLTKLKSKKPISDIDQQLLLYLIPGESIKTSDLKNKFYTKIASLKSKGINFLTKNSYIDPSGMPWQVGMFVLAFLFFGGSFPAFFISFHLGTALFVSSIILFVFALLMPKRTQKGAETYWRMQGFRLFIKMTERYRARFNEKENIFEKFLPYAMLFGMTKIWIENMKKIYGEQYFAAYHPVWFYGYAFTSFDANSLNSVISDLSSNMSSTISSNPSSSGAGGGGFSGGGGGGGGGGGW